ncbi:hypothetical protein GCM10027570_48750 [Streptomonospora sediminis]
MDDLIGRLLRGLGIWRARLAIPEPARVPAAPPSTRRATRVRPYTPALPAPATAVTPPSARPKRVVAGRPYVLAALERAARMRVADRPFAGMLRLDNRTAPVASTSGTLAGVGL